MQPPSFYKPELCQETVYHPEQLRYTGRGKNGNNGYQLHYTKKQCKRKSKRDGYCRQHWQCHNHGKPWECVVPHNSVEKNNNNMEIPQTIQFEIESDVIVAGDISSHTHHPFAIAMEVVVFEISSEHIHWAFDHQNCRLYVIGDYSEDVWPDYYVFDEITKERTSDVKKQWYVASQNKDSYIVAFPYDIQRIKDILKEECGATDRSLEQGFARYVVQYFENTCSICEWRFQGALGFGGKFYAHKYGGMRPDEMTVSCYPEDSTNERNEMISKANQRLADYIKGVAEKNVTR